MRFLSSFGSHDLRPKSYVAESSEELVDEILKWAPKSVMVLMAPGA